MPPTALEHWANVWATKRPAEVSWFEETSATSLATIRRLLPDRTARIVDIGGGASRLVDVLLAAGYAEVTVLDIAGSALGASRARLGDQAMRVEWVVGDALSFWPSRPFALWHDRAMFHFLTDDADIGLYRAALTRSVPTDGWAVVATFAPDGPQRCSNLEVRRHDGPSVAAALAPAVRLVEEFRTVHVTPWGAEQRFAWSVLKRT